MANSLTYHTVTGSFYSEVDPIPGSPVSITPQRDQVSAYVEFSYRLPEGFTPLIDDFDPGDAGPVGDSALLFTDRVARLMNGQLCTIEVGDPIGVELLSNSAVLSTALAAQGVTDLYIDVAFFNVTADGTQLGTLDNFAYKAPVDGTPICLTDPLLTRYEYKGTTPYIPNWQAPEEVDVTPTGESLMTATNVAAVVALLQVTSFLLNGIYAPKLDLSTEPLKASDLDAYTMQQVEDLISAATNNPNPLIASLLDINGLTGLVVNPSTGAVNYMVVNNAGIGGTPGFSIGGSDANVGGFLAPKGNLPWYLIVAAGLQAVFQASGPSTDVDMWTKPKNNGKSLAGKAGNQVVTKLVVPVNSSITLGTDSGTEYWYIMSAGAAFTIPTAIGNGCIYHFVNTTGAAISMPTTGGQTVQGAAGPLVVNKLDTVSLVPDNANWWVY